MSNAAALRPAAGLDDPEVTRAHARVIRSNRFLKRVYEEHYRFLARELEHVPPGARVEIGSGGGFIHEIIPDIISSDLVRVEQVQAALTALKLPFAGESLSALCMINVLHHLLRPRDFFGEALRCLRPGGKVLMVEPAHTPFSRFIFQNFHHEPFEPGQAQWELAPGGRMSSANDALPWIIFCRDRAQFEREFPALKIERIELIHPVSYLLSGGLTLPPLLPVWLYPLVSLCERLAAPLYPLTAMFMRIVLVKQ